MENGEGIVSGLSRWARNSNSGQRGSVKSSMRTFLQIEVKRFRNGRHLRANECYRIQPAAAAPAIATAARRIPAFRSAHNAQDTDSRNSPGMHCSMLLRALKSGRYK